jgi:hypothetical protein
LQIRGIIPTNSMSQSRYRAERPYNKRKASLFIVPWPINCIALLEWCEVYCGSRMSFVELQRQEWQGAINSFIIEKKNARVLLPLLLVAWPII